MVARAFDGVNDGVRSRNADRLGYLEALQVFQRLHGNRGKVAASCYFDSLSVGACRAVFSWALAHNARQAPPTVTFQYEDGRFRAVLNLPISPEQTVFLPSPCNDSDRAVNCTKQKPVSNRVHSSTWLLRMVQLI
jgi:hypothetical protein